VVKQKTKKKNVACGYVYTMSYVSKILITKILYRTIARTSQLLLALYLGWTYWQLKLFVYLDNIY